MKFLSLLLVFTSSLSLAQTVYLTFDDGPINATKDVVELLNKHEVKASFFINAFHLDGIGDEREDKAKESLLLTLESGHLVANHSYNHMLHNCCDGDECGAKVCNRIAKWSTDSYMDVEEDLKFFALNDAKVLEHIGNAHDFENYKMNELARFPYSNIWRLDNMSAQHPCPTRDSDGGCKSAERSFEMADLLFEQGIRSFGWNYDIWGMASGSAKSHIRQITRLAKRCQQSVPGFDCEANANKVVVLLHDFHFEDSHRGKGASVGLKNLEALIIGLKEAGFSFDTVDNY